MWKKNRVLTVKTSRGLCEKMRSTAVIEAAIDTAVGLGYTKFIVMGWSSGGAMASGFLDYAHKQAFVTRNGTRYTVPGLVLLSSGGQFCYAYKQLSEPSNKLDYFGGTFAEGFVWLM